MNRKGHVLIHVLITTIIVVVIATGLAQMLLMRFTAANRAAGGVAGRRQDEGSFNRVLAAWNANGAVCSNGPVSGIPAGFSCSGCSAAVAGNPGSCGCSVTASCTCTDSGSCPGSLTTQTVTVGTDTRCRVRIASCQ